jgi:phosphatidylethanolamine-binding protein (PEBP) family uncharacterized protein
VHALTLLAILLIAQPSGFTLTRPAFKHNGPLPVEFTGYGAFKSPPLEWSGAPPGTKQFALIVENPDVPVARVSLHWLLYRIPATVTRLPETARPADVKIARPAPVKGAAQGTKSP